LLLNLGLKILKLKLPLRISNLTATEATGLAGRLLVVAERHCAVCTRHCVNLLFDLRQIQQSLRVVDVVVVGRDGDDDDRRSPIT